MVERFYIEFFGFLFNNTSPCYVRVRLHLSSLSFYLLITAVFVINFGLKCFTNLGLAYIHHSAHILFVYKLMLIIL